MRRYNAHGHDHPVPAQARTIHIDIGGGAHADYFRKRARHHPEHTYLVLDPAITHRPRACPPNLQLIRWRSDNDPDAHSQLPVKRRSIDMAHLSFLLGELRGRSRPSYADDPHHYTYDAEIGRYRHLLHGLKHALKQGGQVHVSEPQANILRVQDLFTEEGFTIVHPPTVIADKHKTAWITAFYHVVDQVAATTTAAPALPMELVAEL
jgi:hypothetical protein